MNGRLIQECGGCLVVRGRLTLALDVADSQVEGKMVATTCDLTHSWRRKVDVEDDNLGDVTDLQRNPRRYWTGHESARV